MGGVPNPLLTVPGLGPPVSWGIIAEIVDISRFPDHPELAAYAGLIWKHSNQAPSKLRIPLSPKRALELTARKPCVKYYIGKLVRLVHALLAENIPYAMPQMTLML